MRRIRSFEHLERLKGKACLVLFSGGLDGAFVLHRLRHIGCHALTALTVDLGAGAVAEAATEAFCRTTGVAWLRQDDRETFATEFVAPAIYSQGLYLGAYPISASLSRPLLAKRACERARELGCTAIVHTSNVSQNSLRRFDGAIEMLGFEGAYGSPFERTAISRDEKRRTLREAGFGAFGDRETSTDINIWCREMESGSLDDPERLDMTRPIFEWTREVQGLAPRVVALEFERGLPVRLDGVAAPLWELLPKLNSTVGTYGIGRFVGLEELPGGAKVQEVRETPGAAVLMDAYRRLESATVSAECIRERLHAEQLWVREAVEGRWFGPLREASQAFARSIAERVSGVVEYDVQLRSFQPRSVRARNSTYVRDRTSFESIRVAELRDEGGANA